MFFERRRGLVCFWGFFVVVVIGFWRHFLGFGVFFLFVCLSQIDFSSCRWEDSRRQMWWKLEKNWKDCVSTVYLTWTVETAMSSYRLQHCSCVPCMHSHKQKKPLAWFFFFSYQHQKCEFCPLLEPWTSVLVSILECGSEKVLFCHWPHYLMLCSPAQWRFIHFICSWLWPYVRPQLDSFMLQGSRLCVPKRGMAGLRKTSLQSLTGQ